MEVVKRTSITALSPKRFASAHMRSRACSRLSAHELRVFLDLAADDVPKDGKNVTTQVARSNRVSAYEAVSLSDGLV